MTYKADFPIFQNQPSLVYLDSAATTQKPELVIDTMNLFYREDYASIHRSLYDLSLKSTEKYEHVRQQVATFLQASSEEVVFTHGATEALNLLAFSLGETLQEGDEVILSELEHHANLVPWQQLVSRKGIHLKFAPFTDQGTVDIEKLRELITNRTRIVSLSLCSNVFGTILPAAAVKSTLRQQGSKALFILDASQAVAHFPISVTELGCDFLVFSGHKMYAPAGTGILWGRKELLADLSPFHTGGDMIKTVTLEKAEWNDSPYKFEAGTANIEGIIGLGAALIYLEQIGMSRVMHHTHQLTTSCLSQLQEIPEVHSVGTPNPQSGIISFTVDGIHPHDLAQTLAEQQVCIRAGHHCAAPLHHKLGIPATARVSFGIYNEESDITRFIVALKESIAFFTHV